MDYVTLEGLMGAAAISVPLIVLIMSGVKTILQGEYSKYYPTMALAFGILLNIWFELLFGSDGLKALGISATVGLIAGFLAVKTYEQGSK